MALIKTVLFGGDGRVRGDGGGHMLHGSSPLSRGNAGRLPASKHGRRLRSGHTHLYKLGDRWWKEPFERPGRGAMSSFTHVEIAIGSDHGRNGEMVNVCRVFNDNQGVELTARTGRNPQ